MRDDNGSPWRAAMRRTREKLGIQRGVAVEQESTVDWLKRTLAIEARQKAEKQADEAARKRESRRLKAANEGRAFRSWKFLGHLSPDELCERKKEQNRAHQEAYRARTRARQQTGAATA